MLVGDHRPLEIRKSPHPLNSRLILAFFPAGDPAIERAAKRVKKTGAHPIVAGDRNANSALVRRYFRFHLESEQLLVAEAPPASVQTVVEEIRLEHPASVFVVPEVFTASEDRTEPADINDLSWASKVARISYPQSDSLPQFIRSRLGILEAAFDKATADLASSVALGHSPGLTANWILENGYLVQNEVEEMRNSLDNAPKKSDPGANYAQVQALALGLLRHSEHEITEERMQDALREFQTVRSLTTAELWSFTQLLNLALLEELSRVASDAAAAHQHREAAYLWADRLIVSARHSEDALNWMLTGMNGESYARDGTFLAA